jgi:hypothetical protein
MDQTSMSSDPLVNQFLSAGTEDRQQEVISRLLAEHAYGRIDGILASRFRQSSLPRHHRDDIRSEILVRLIHRLSQLATGTKSEPIASFPDYVAVVAFNTFDDFVRRAFPLRTKLRNRVRYVLNHDPALALWESEDVIVAGLARWRGQPAKPATYAPRAKKDLRAMLLELFQHTGTPVTLEGVISMLAPVHDVPENESPQEVERQRAVATSRHPADEIESRQYLRALWKEICELPLRQRMALLLHARDADGESVTRLLPVSGVATMHQIGDTLSLPHTELMPLWDELPLDDLKIATLLQVSRQQVINLRRSARDRLERRMSTQQQIRTPRPGRKREER